MCISTLIIGLLIFIFFFVAENACLIKHLVNKVEAFDTKLFIPKQQNIVCLSLAPNNLHRHFNNVKSNKYRNEALTL